MNRSLSLVSSIALLALAPSFLLLLAPAVRGGNEIPKTAWKRPLGLPLENPGVKRGATDIDDGYWQGAPVGGFGSGTFSRTYRGDFARWHGTILSVPENIPLSIPSLGLTTSGTSFPPT